MLLPTNRPTRRKFLERSARGAGSVFLLPSLLGSCLTDHHIPTADEPATNWIGGFAQSNPAFAYPNPDLSSLPLLDNMDNIDLLQRQQGVKWPEFSWETKTGSPDPKRCFQLFATYVSRIGYTNTGRVYSIISPQQGVCSTNYGCINIEVSVTGQRGWVDEPSKTLAADMSVEGKVWFSPSALQTPDVQKLWDPFRKSNLPFPATKATAVRVSTYRPDNPDQSVFPVRSGKTTRFTIPDFALHPEAWTIGHIEVAIGAIKKTTSPLVDEFNQLFLDFFNLSSGNMLQAGNVLTWNLWSIDPAGVDQQEWRSHAEQWGGSINLEHEHGPDSIARYADGSALPSEAQLLDYKFEELNVWVQNHL